MINKFRVAYDSRNHVYGIRFGNFTVLQLHTGTKRNHEFAELIVEILNDHLEGNLVIFPDPFDKMKILIRKLRKSK